MLTRIVACAQLIRCLYTCPIYVRIRLSFSVYCVLNLTEEYKRSWRAVLMDFLDVEYSFIARMLMLVSHRVKSFDVIYFLLSVI